MIEAKFSIGATADARAIRKEVFVEEQGFENEFDEKDERLWEIVLYWDGYPISTGRMEALDPETYRFGRIAVRKAFRNKQIGTYTMKFLMRKAIEIGGRVAVVHAQYDKMGFYEKLGFRAPKGSEVFDEDGYPHIEMRKSLIKKRNVKRTA